MFRWCQINFGIRIVHGTNNATENRIASCPKMISGNLKHSEVHRCWRVEGAASDKNYFVWFGWHFVRVIVVSCSSKCEIVCAISAFYFIYDKKTENYRLFFFYCKKKTGTRINSWFDRGTVGIADTWTSNCFFLYKFIKQNLGNSSLILVIKRLKRFPFQFLLNSTPIWTIFMICLSDVPWPPEYDTHFSLHKQINLQFFGESFLLLNFKKIVPFLMIIYWEQNRLLR